MIEKVNPSHPDKVADRIAGAIVDLAYATEDNPKIAVEVLIGHGVCHAIIETTTALDKEEIAEAIVRIAGEVLIDLYITKQDQHLTKNQAHGIRCGDNGIFKGTPLTQEQKELSAIARRIYKQYPSDGKYILDGIRLIICQSNATTADLAAEARAIIKSGGAVYAAMLSGDAVTLSADSLPADFSVVIGNEGQGVRPDVAAVCTGCVRIPQTDRAESLNAAVAAAIFMWEMRKTDESVP